MRAAIEETTRRRERQVAYNTEHGIVPETIIKEIRDINSGLRRVAEERAELDVAGKEPEELASMMTRLEAQMKEAARNLEFERAAALRDESENPQDKNDRGENEKTCSKNAVAFDEQNLRSDDDARHC